MTNEEFYDSEIAPVLKALSEKCFDRGMAFIAVVEYDHENQGRGRTVSLPENPSLEMVMINHCAKTVPNVDGYMIGLKRYAHENGIDTSQSIYLSFYDNKGNQ